MTQTLASAPRARFGRPAKSDQRPSHGPARSSFSHGSLALKPRPQAAPAGLDLVSTSTAPQKKKPLWTSLGLMLVVALLAILTPLLINTHLATLSYETHSAQKEITAIHEENEQLKSEIERLSSPAHIQEMAEKGGLQEDGKKGYISLKAGTIENGYDNKHS